MAVTAEDVHNFIKDIRENKSKEYLEALKKGAGVSDRWGYSHLDPFDNVNKSAWIHPFRSWGEEKFEKEHLFYAYETGGVSGGSCWESSNPQPYVEDGKDTGFIILEWVVEHFAPDLTFLQFQKLSREVLQFDHTEYEYYGNRTEYCVQYIPIETVLKFINKN